MMSVMLGNELGAHQQAKLQRTKRSVACNYCRLKKVRCNGELPTCANCLDRGEQCVYATLKRRSRRQSSHDCNEHLIEKIARMEAMLEEANVRSQSQSYGENAQHKMAAESLQMMSNCAQIQQQHVPVSPPQTDTSYQSFQWTSPEVLHTIPMPCGQDNRHAAIAGRDAFQNSKASPDVLKENSNEETYHQRMQIPQLVHKDNTHESRTDDGASYQSNEAPEIEPALRSGEKTPMDKSVNSVYSPENSDWEYHGPGSYLSLCSKPGVDWVAERTGSSEFSHIARTFSRATTRPLKLDQKINPERAPEPDRETARRYVKVFFEKTFDATSDIVNRITFEARLKAHFDNGIGHGQEDDHAWYALRNVIYAHGCRFELAQGGYSYHFTEAQAAGWQFFENALSKYLELCFCRSGLMAVQALLCMALYAEALSCPSIEYMLLSSALRLAQSKGLHRQPGSTWGISPQDTHHRNRIFWLLYTYEKHVAHRSGRASAIDDDDISCQIPTQVSSSSRNSLEYFTLATKHAQIASQIAKRCSTVAAYRQSPDEVVQTVCELDQQLRKWRDLHPPTIRPGAVFDPANLPSDLQITHILYLHYSYYGSLIGIHSIFTYPWSGMLGRVKSPGIRDQVNVSTEIVAEASRSIILMTKYINDIYAWTPTWMAFYYPVLALIILFVHVLKHPTAATAQSDIALMDVMSGHLARMEFASSGQIGISIARDLSGLARLAIKRAAQSALSINDEETPSVTVEASFVPYDQLHNQTLDYALDNINMGDFDMENWSTLLPSFSPNDMMDFSVDGQHDLFGPAQ